MRIERHCTLDAEPEEVWEYLTDATGWRKLMHGLSRFEPQAGAANDEESHIEEGARFHIHMHVGSADVGGLIEIVEAQEQRDIAWTSITGIDQRGRWRLREEPDGRTRVTLRLSYGAPGGLIGTIADRLSAGTVGDNLERTLKNLRREIEGEGGVEEDGLGIPGRVAYTLGSVRILAEAGIIRPIRPDRLVRMGVALARWGRSPAAGSVTLAERHPDDPMIVDELGTLSFAEVDARTNRLAHALSDAGIVEGDGVAIMARNHRGFIESTMAVSKLGADALYLNTAFAGPQLEEVVQREKPRAIIYDEEFSELLAEAGKRRKRFVAWHDSTDGLSDPTLEELIEGGDPDSVVPPEREGRAVILTSGTTGTPKGASRGNPQSMDPAVALLSRIPLKARQVSHIAAPLFHSWGFAHFTMGLLLGSTYVLRRKFEPEACLAEIARYRCDSLVVVPVMMQRILDLPEDTRRKYDLSSLKVVGASGSALPGDLATDWMDAFGDTLFNLYGSTEVAWATIATPEDMRAAPGTAGRPPRGTVVRLIDDKGVEVPTGETGRIFVGNEMMFEGYTGGGNKDMVDGLMATGDVGRMDEAGRLFVEGRDDEMIVSGGENVFPKEVEDLLARHDKVADVAAIGVDDKKFGQALKAFVVPKGQRPSEDELKKYVKSNLANFKVPKAFEFLDELPRNATGKILKKELAEREDGKSGAKK